jgi:hypothetical protein
MPARTGRRGETGFDPAQVIDMYSRTVTPHIFEGLYEYDHLARPARIKPLTAAAMPEARCRRLPHLDRAPEPGILFADDPAFKGRRASWWRPTTSTAFKRLPTRRSAEPDLDHGRADRHRGLAEAASAVAGAAAGPFDYDTPARRPAGAGPLHAAASGSTPAGPRFLQCPGQPATCWAPWPARWSRRYGDDSMAAPGGHRAVPAGEWRRSSLIVLERNPGYRERRYDAEPAADDAEGQAILARLQRQAACR